MKKPEFIIMCFLLFAATTFSFVLGKQWQLFVTGMVLLSAGIWLLRVNPFSLLQGKLLIFGPSLTFLLLVTLVLLFYSNYHAVPFLLIAIISSSIAIWSYRYPLRSVIPRLLVSMSVFAIMSIFLMNYYYFTWDLQDEFDAEGKSFTDFDLVIRDESGKLIDPDQLRGQISVIDIWSSSCGVCIESFPNYEEVRGRFQKDTVLKFYSLNIALDADDRQRVEKFTRPYNFTKLYTDQNGFQKLGINGVPYYVVLDENLIIKYKGALLTNQTTLYKNFYNVIREIRNKE